MVVVYTVGDPDLAEYRAMAALYGSVFEMRRNLREQGYEYKIGPLCVRWLNADDARRDKWLAAWALPVPEGTTTMPQVVPGLAVKIEVWRPSSVAEAVHEGPVHSEADTLGLLRQSIVENGYQIIGVPEEEYQSPPRAKRDRVTFRFPIQRTVSEEIEPGKLLLLDWALGELKIEGLSDIG